MKNAFWGPSYKEEDILMSINQRNLNFRKLEDNNQLTNFAAKIVADGNVVGWYQGRSGGGARALGNRSIIANPANKNMKNIINSKIKKRESFDLLHLPF